jgi:hypothetical protein
VNKQVEIDLYPNPSNGNFTISSNTKLKSVSITDYTGKIVLQKNDLETGVIDLDFSNFDSGVYIIKTKTNDNDEQIQKHIKL